MGIFPQTEEISFSLGQKNNTAACLLPCSTHLAKCPWSLVPHHVVFDTLVFHIPPNPCAPTVQIPGAHRSRYAFLNLIPATFYSRVIPDLLNRQIFCIYGESACQPLRRRAGKTQPRCYKPFPWHFLHHGEPVFLSNQFFLLLFVICKFCMQLQGCTNRSVVKIGHSSLKENCQDFEVWNWSDEIFQFLSTCVYTALSFHTTWFFEACYNTGFLFQHNVWSQKQG